jgi:methylmalonyl-CoA/ethylmalonyl-CoA epimerase
MPRSGIEGAKLDHVACGVARIAEAAGFVAGVLGGEPWLGGPGIQFVFAQWRFEGGGLLELIEPVGPPNGFLRRFLASRGPGVHHVTFKVKDLALACERVREAGLDVVGFDDSSPGWKEAFLHPKQAQGVVVQLAESHPELDGGGGEAWRFPPGPAAPPPPVRLLGLHLAARDLRAARRQWGELLGGAERRLGPDLVFVWPDSPLRIRVSPQPEGPEGPLALELAAARDLELPPRTHPVLGTRFERVEA